MILAVDIGNTTVGLHGMWKDENGRVSNKFSAKTDTIKNAPREHWLYKIAGELLRQGVTADSFEGSILSSVAPELDDVVSDAIAELLGAPPLRVSCDIRTGMTFDVKDPSGLGADRIVDAAYAAATYHLPAMTVDLGTATTVNVIDEGGVFLGGIICPGVETSLLALTTRTSKLPMIIPQKPEHLIGRDTEECMLSGTIMGAAAMIDGFAERIEERVGHPVTLAITGGLSYLVAPLCRYPHVREPELLSKGLYLLYEMNSGR